MPELTCDENHIYRLDGIIIPGVSSTLEDAGLTGRPPGIPDDVWVRAGKFGNAVHETCRLYDLGTLDEKKLDPNLVGWLDGWRKFKDVFCITEFEAIEQKVFSRRFKFGGRLDRIANIKKRTIIDIKTPTMKKRATGVQLAGYQEAYQEMTKKRIRERLAVHLKDGGYSLEVYEDPSDRDCFLECLQHNRSQTQIDNWKRRIK